jgi:hypothetical protein
MNLLTLRLHEKVGVSCNWQSLQCSFHLAATMLRMLYIGEIGLHIKWTRTVARNGTVDVVPWLIDWKFDGIVSITGDVRNWWYVQIIVKYYLSHFLQFCIINPDTVFGEMLFVTEILSLHKQEVLGRTVGSGELLLALASTVILSSYSQGIHDHILQSHD